MRCCTALSSPQFEFTAASLQDHPMSRISRSHLSVCCLDGIEAVAGMGMGAAITYLAGRVTAHRLSVVPAGLPAAR
jgi:hypothetical protein